jgi:Uma2 family endonuclease
LLNGFRWSGRSEVPIQVLTGPAVLRLSEEQKPEPDVFVRPLELDEPRALLVIEVLSKSHKKYDLEFKAREYQDAGLPEIWYVDDVSHALHIDRKAGDRYQRTTHTTGRVESSALPGFWIDVAWLWLANLPNPRECLQRVLA